ncbi:MAG: hypothetical protein JEZ06_14420 [Anaerolineaceae bacterium]|nr:hypothetical protein [Anaerolineaceae bacterium]
MNKRLFSYSMLILVLISLILVSGCTGPETSAEAEKELIEEKQEVEEKEEKQEEKSDEVLPTDIPTEIPASPPTQKPDPTDEPALPALPPEPQEIEFTAEDGQVLVGRYYPAAVNPAPMVVLMHWAPGDINDWNEIAPWLQNRGMTGLSANAGTEPWLEPSWFPIISENVSYAAFTFTFRGCEGGCSAFKPDGWLLDAKAAMETARELEGVDPTQLVALGASIGADGAPDGCKLLNEEFENSCQGGFSLSPGHYLTLNYVGVVAALEAESLPKPVWCLAATGDVTSLEVCQAAAGDHYRSFIYEGNYHGMELWAPDFDPNPTDLTLEWLQLTLPQ